MAGMNNEARKKKALCALLWMGKISVNQPQLFLEDLVSIPQDILDTFLAAQKDDYRKVLAERLLEWATDDLIFLLESAQNTIARTLIMAKLTQDLPRLFIYAEYQHPCPSPQPDS